MLAITLSDRDFAGSAALGDGWRTACERVDAGAVLADAAPVLSMAERTRLGAMRDSAGADLRRAAHIWKRRAAGARLGVAPEDVIVGPPHAPLADGSFISLSHTTDAVAVALCEAPVGVDIEPVRDRGDHERLAARFFSDVEAALIGALAPADAAFAFAWRWTAKEALLKAMDLRLGIALATPIPQGEPPFAATIAGARLFVFAPAPGFVCTVARRA